MVKKKKSSLSCSFSHIPIFPYSHIPIFPYSHFRLVRSSVIKNLLFIHYAKYSYIIGPIAFPAGQVRKYIRKSLTCDSYYRT